MSVPPTFFPILRFCPSTTYDERSVWQRDRLQISEHIVDIVRSLGSGCLGLEFPIVGVGVRGRPIRGQAILIVIAPARRAARRDQAAAIPVGIIVVGRRHRAVGFDFLQPASGVVGIIIRGRGPTDGLQLLGNPAQFVAGVIHGEDRRTRDVGCVRTQLTERVIAARVSHGPESRARDQPMLRIPADRECACACGQRVVVIAKRDGVAAVDRL